MILFIRDNTQGMRIKYAVVDWKLQETSGCSDNRVEESEVPSSEDK